MLAIILFVVTPMILGVVNSAQKGVAENSTYVYIDTIEKTDLKNMIAQGTPTIRTDSIYNLSNIGPVEYKGTASKEICVVIKDGRALLNGTMGCSLNLFCYIEFLV